VVVGAQAPVTPEALAEAAAPMASDIWNELREAAVRLPLAAILGTVLALRPKRAGTPERSMPVVETQIILAVVGALIMLVVGASLARAFGIVGAANLIRYRAKIEDPKDAVVMLAALAVGLASGVGLFALAVFGTLFTALVLWAIESFEPVRRKVFELKMKRKEGLLDLRPRIEQTLSAFRATFEIRTSSDEELLYLVRTDPDFPVDHASTALTALAAEGELAVEWDEKKKAA
jgi:hypothetical protein